MLLPPPSLAVHVRRDENWVTWAPRAELPARARRRPCSSQPEWAIMSPLHLEIGSISIKCVSRTSAQICY